MRFNELDWSEQYMSISMIWYISIKWYTAEWGTLLPLPALQVNWKENNQFANLWTYSPLILALRHFVILSWLLFKYN